MIERLPGGIRIYGDGRVGSIYIYLLYILYLYATTTRFSKTNWGFLRRAGPIAPFPWYARGKVHVQPVHVDAERYVREAFWAIFPDYTNGNANT